MGVREPPESPRQSTQLAVRKRNGCSIWRTYELKEQFQAIFVGAHKAAAARGQVDHGVTRALRCGLVSFVKVAHIMRQRRAIIVNVLEHGISNGRVEGMNTKVRLLIRRAYGFHSAEAALALDMLACGPINLKLPHERPLDSGGEMTHNRVRRA
jgi:transposase